VEGEKGKGLSLTRSRKKETPRGKASFCEKDRRLPRESKDPGERKKSARPGRRGHLPGKLTLARKRKEGHGGLLLVKGEVVRLSVGSGVFVV